MNVSDVPPKAPEPKPWEQMPPVAMPPPHPRDIENEQLNARVDRMVAENKVLLREIDELQKIITLLQNSGKVTAEQVDAARSLLNA